MEGGGREGAWREGGRWGFKKEIGGRKEDRKVCMEASKGRAGLEGGREGGMEGGMEGGWEGVMEGGERVCQLYLISKIT